MLYISMLLAVALLTGTAGAAPIEYRFEFTAADLLNNTFVDGVDGSTAADNQLFDGARTLRWGTKGNHSETARTFVESQHEKFNQRWDQYVEEGYILDQFNLWGFDNGVSTLWGEDYKPYEWVWLEGPANWEMGFVTLASPPAGYHTDQVPYWKASAPAYGISIGASLADLESYAFAAIIAFDVDDMWWGQDTQGAPNSLSDLMTFWFGSYLRLYDMDQGSNGFTLVNSHIYEGNFGSETIHTPEPGTLFLLGTGLLGLVGYQRKRGRQ